MGSVMCGRRGAVGSATAENVLAGKTFSSDKGVNIAGTMPDRGEYQYANGSGGGSGYYAFNGIPEGYYHSDGHDWAPEIRIPAKDAKNSQMWKDAYNSGYTNGVTNGKAGARLVLISQTSFANNETKTINIASGILIWNGGSKKFDCFMKNKNSVSHLIDAYAKDQDNNGNPISLRSATDTTVTFNGRYGTISAYQIQ